MTRDSTLGFLPTPQLCRNLPTLRPNLLAQIPGFTIPHFRWTICALLFLASTINYLDRQTLSVLKPHLQSVLHWSESDYGWIVFAFQFAYALMFTVAGLVMDWLGTRLGYALSITWWSIAAMAHALARGALSFGAARFFLGAGEAGNFPAAIKAVAEWFPKRERALATGIFNAGPTVGAVIAPPLVVWLTLRWGWREAFIFTGALGFIWLFFWVALYRLPREHPWITPGELEFIESGEGEEETATVTRIPWQKILAYRQAWGFILAKFMTDPIWWFYIFWLPSYLKQGRGFTLEEIGLFAWIPFLVSGVGSVAGGWLSGFFLKRGWPLSRARKTAMALCAFCMPSGIVAVFAPNISAGAGPHFPFPRRAPGMVGEYFYPGLRYVPQTRCGLGYRPGRDRRGRGRHDPGAGRGLHPPVVPYLRASLHHRRHHAPSRHRACALDDSQDRTRRNYE